MTDDADILKDMMAMEHDDASDATLCMMMGAKNVADDTDIDDHQATALAATGVEAIERDFNHLPHLKRDQSITARERKARIVDATRCQTASEAIGAIPGANESVHIIISGKFALWDFVPAIMMMARPVRAEALTIATLGFSKRNIYAMCDMVDAGVIERARLLCSHYFKATSGDIYETAEKALNQRPAVMSFLSVRTHAKLLLLKLRNGTCLTIESSANLRSCQNIEQASLFNSPELYQVHYNWIDSLFVEAGRSAVK